MGVGNVSGTGDFVGGGIGVSVEIGKLVAVGDVSGTGDSVACGMGVSVGASKLVAVGDGSGVSVGGRVAVGGIGVEEAGTTVAVVEGSGVVVAVEI
jgi:hypothetical protein